MIIDSQVIAKYIIWSSYKLILPTLSSGSFFTKCTTRHILGFLFILTVILLVRMNIMVVIKPWNSVYLQKKSSILYVVNCIQWCSLLASFQYFVGSVREENGLPATHDKMAHSTIVGVAPRLTVTSCESHALSSSLSNHSAIRTSIRWDAKINRTAKHTYKSSTRELEGMNTSK